MGNSKSSFEHEKLEEHSEKYFAKVAARNKIKSRDMSIPSPPPLPHRRSSLRKLITSPFRSSRKRHPVHHNATDVVSVSSDTHGNVRTARSRAGLSERAETSDPQLTSPTLTVMLSDNNTHKAGRKRSKLRTGGPLQPPRGNRRSPAKSALMSSSSSSHHHHRPHTPTSPQDENRLFEATLRHGLVYRELERAGKVTCVSFSGSRLAVGGEDGSVGICDLDSDDAATRELPREGKVRSLHWSPDGRWLAVGGNDCCCAIVDGASFETVAEIEREDRVYAVRWNPAGDAIAVGGFDGMVAVCGWDGERTELRTEIPRLGLVLALSWSSDGRFLAVGGSDKRAAVVSTDAWEVVGEVQRPGSVQCVEWSPDGRYLGVGGHDGAVAVVDVANRAVRKEIFRSRGGRVTDLSWSPDGSFLAVAGTDRRCAVYETASYVPVHDVTREGHVTCVDWQGGDGKYLAVGGEDKMAAVVKTGGLCVSSSCDANSTTTSDVHGDEWSTSDAGTLSNDDAALPDWVLTDAFEETRSTDDDGHVVVNAVAVNRGSSLVAVAKNDGTTTLFDTTNRWTVRDTIPTPRPVQCLAFSHNNEYLALGSEHAAVVVLSLPRCVPLATLHHAGDRCHALGFSPDSHYLAVGAADGLLRIVATTDDWEVVGEADDDDAPVYALDWSDTHLAVGRNNATCDVHERAHVEADFWSAKSELKRNSAVNAVKFCQGGALLAVGGGDWTVAIYSSNDNWTIIRELKMDGWILSVDWSPDGEYLAMGGTDSKGGMVVRTSTWERVDLYETSPSSVPTGVGIGEETRSVRWTDDGNWLAVAGTGGVVRIVDVDNWAIKHRIGSDMVQEESHSSIHMDDDNDSTSHSSSSSSTSLPRRQQHEEPVSSDDDEDSTSSHSSVNETSIFATESTTELLIFKDSDSTEGEIRHKSMSSSKQHGYSSRTEPTKFLSTCRDFLSPYDFRKPPPVLNTFYALVVNLKDHLTYVHAADPAVRESLATQDGGVTLYAVCRILESATVVMEEVLDDEDGVPDWWRSKEKFDLDFGEMGRLTSWNEWWREVDGDSFPIDLDLLRRVDEVEMTDTAEELAYHSIEDDNGGGNNNNNNNVVNVDDSPDHDHWDISNSVGGVGGGKFLLNDFANETDDSSSSYSSSEEEF